MITRPSLYKSILFALKGIFWMLKNERNFQIEIGALLVNIILLFFLKLSVVDAVIIMICCSLVLSLEMLNTAIEKLCDFVHQDFHSAIGLVKDISASAVLLVTIFSIIIGFLVYYPYFVSLYEILINGKFTN